MRVNVIQLVRDGAVYDNGGRIGYIYEVRPRDWRARPFGRWTVLARFLVRDEESK